MKYILAIVLTVSLQGCALLDIFKKPQPPAINTQVVSIDSAKLEQCDKLPEDIVIGSFEYMLTVHGELVSLYAKCAGKQSDSIILLKKFGNVK